MHANAKGEEPAACRPKNWKHMPVSLWLWSFFSGQFFFFMKYTHTAGQYVLEWLLSFLVCMFEVCLMVVFQVFLSFYCKSMCNSVFLR